MIAIEQLYTVASDFNQCHLQMINVTEVNRACSEQEIK